MRILGVDPGTGRMGYGVVDARGGTVACLTVGCVTTPSSLPHADRLGILRERLQGMVREYRPRGAVVERLFFSKNTRTALAVAEARGVILSTLADAGIPIVELSPQAVKLGVTGYGRATKTQVQRMVQELFTLPAPPSPDDAADALALAFAGLAHFPR